MDADPHYSTGYAAEIRSLIRETEGCLKAAGDDREARLQREAFRERCERALALARQLAQASPDEVARLDGDAWRARESLALSRQFFRGRVPAELKT